MRRLAAALTTATLVAAAGMLGATTASAAGTGAVYVVHGIPDTPVDVYVDGTLAIDDFDPLTVQGPIDLPAGDHEIALTAADAADASSPVLSGTATIPDGGNVSLVAHLSAAGEPALTPFVNDVAAVPAGQARLVVRHTAAAPAVDIRAGGEVVLADVTNPNEGALEVPAGTISADVVLAGTDTVAIGPADLTLAEGTATFVHAVGSADAGDLGLVSFTISGLGSAPSGVPAGSGPMESALPTVLLVLALTTGAGLIVVSGRRLVRSR
ncbi:DUF4397 domain-containing protein [Nakamurella sp. YIM 132087]|uniref:DUF4397 domain-containing protein n=1 Tax=Nakamurella alba TaxID=2665158 RepID=A0A7K1FPD4_9ACTN|nr:DUF4397 domain-containing protein [Nakamurella alba]MTD15199.1 DUF4397 domain-containing protein [Nakamurella alba]